MADGFLPEGDHKHGHYELTSSNPCKTTGTLHDARGATYEVSSDEPEPMGTETAPSPVTYLFHSLVSCQLTALSKCLQKARIEEYQISAEASFRFREEEGPEEMGQAAGLRADHIDVDLTLNVPEDQESRAQRCLEVFDQGCLVGQSLRAGVDYATAGSVICE